MNNILKATLALTLTLASCSAQRQINDTEAGTPIVMGIPASIGSSPHSTSSARMIPQAIIYRTNGTFTDNVPITMSADGKEIVSYPDPRDITARSSPIPLKDGFYLDRRGITPTTTFTRYTYKEYAGLSEPPSREELINSIIRGAEVTEIIRLPLRASAAAEDPALCDSIIDAGMGGCTIVLKRNAILINPEQQ